MHLTALFPHLAGLRIDDVTVRDDCVSLTATTTRRATSCPLCHRCSRRVHNHYQRRVADLPIGSMPVTLLLHVRRFRCVNPRCPRRIFAERLPALVAPGGRRSHPLRAALERVAFALGGEAGARLASALGLPTTPDVLLRLIRAAPLPDIGTPRRVGVDDFALRKGRTYAGLVVDLDARRSLDVLPDCTAATIAAWLAGQPSIRLVSRDRGAAIVEGVTRGAPGATQVADRWHLLKNLGEALERMLVRTRTMWHNALVCNTSADERDEMASDGGKPDVAIAALRLPTPHALQAAQERQARRDRRIARYEEVRHLHREGWSGHAIARTLHLSRTTAQGYLTRKRSKLDPYKAYLERRWQEGCHNAQLLLDEARGQGYMGGHSILRAYVATFRPRLPPGTPTPERLMRVRAEARPTWSPRQLVALFLWRPDDLTEEQARVLTRIRAAQPMLNGVYEAMQAFAVMVRERQVDGLTAWVEGVGSSERVDSFNHCPSMLQRLAFFPAVRRHVPLTTVIRLVCVQRCPGGRALRHVVHWVQVVQAGGE